MSSKHELPELEEVRILAERLMDEHGLLKWKFKFTNAVRQYGHCAYRTKTIAISRNLALLNGIDRTKNTILHEIAHALAGPGTGHGPLWKVTALNIGCDGNRCYDSTTVVAPKRKWKGECPGCKRTIYRHKRTAISC